MDRDTDWVLAINSALDVLKETIASAERSGLSVNLQLTVPSYEKPQVTELVQIHVEKLRARIWRDYQQMDPRGNAL